MCFPKLNASLEHSLTYDVYKRDSTHGHCFLTLGHVHAINPLTITIYGDNSILSTHCILGNFACFLSSADFFLEMKQEYHRNVRQFGP